MRRAFIGLGSNLGDRLSNILFSIKEIQKIRGVKFKQVSGLYVTEPVGYVHQNEFLNAVVELGISINPENLLGELIKIEKRMGRTREVKWGPRIIDLDILLIETKVSKTGKLILPHKELANRRFVLVPLQEIASDFLIGGSGKTVKKLLNDTKDNGKVDLYMTSDAVLKKLNEV